MPTVIRGNGGIAFLSPAASLSTIPAVRGGIVFTGSTFLAAQVTVDGVMLWRGTALVI